MKYLTLLTFSVILFVSCQKKQCWTCHVSQKGDSALYPQNPDTILHFDVPVCDKTKREIKAVESDAMSKGEIPHGSSLVVGKFESVDCD